MPFQRALRLSPNLHQPKLTTMASSFKMVLFQHHPDQLSSGTTNLQQPIVITPTVQHPALEAACMSRAVLHRLYPQNTCHVGWHCPACSPHTDAASMCLEQAVLKMVKRIVCTHYYNQPAVFELMTGRLHLSASEDGSNMSATADTSHPVSAQQQRQGSSVL